MKRLVLVRAFTCGVLALLLVSCLFPPYEHTPEYFKSKNRDPNLVGVWTLEVEVKGCPDLVFKSNGEVIWDYSKDGYTNKEGYYYTEGDILYFLDIGDGFKMNNTVRKMKYEIDEKNQRFRFKSIESAMWEPVFVRKNN